MGNCCSIPNKKRVDLHRQKGNIKNDHYFTELPFADSKLKTFEINPVEDYILEIEKVKISYMKKIELHRENEAISELTIEIQKGVDLNSRGCIKKPDPFIRVSLEPKGPFFDTNTANINLPEWFYVIHTRQPISSFKLLKFLIMFDENTNKALGSFTISLSELESQLTHTKWYSVFPFKPHKKQHPMVLVRIQLISNETNLYQSLINLCSEEIEKLQRLVLEIGGINK